MIGTTIKIGLLSLFSLVISGICVKLEIIMLIPFIISSILLAKQIVLLFSDRTLVNYRGGIVSRRRGKITQRVNNKNRIISIPDEVYKKEKLRWEYHINPYNLIVIIVVGILNVFVMTIGPAIF